MNDEVAFLAAILANPADNTVRLVFADWLEEHGGQPERAEFIRVQCELASSNWITALRSIKLRWRERALLHRRGGLLGDKYAPLLFLWEWAWLAGEGEFRGHQEPAILFSRGFVSSLACDWFDWTDHAEELRAFQPIERVRLLTEWPDFDRPESREEATRQLESLYPGITFELPPREDEELS